MPDTAKAQHPEINNTPAVGQSLFDLEEALAELRTQVTRVEDRLSWASQSALGEDGIVPVSEPEEPRSELRATIEAQTTSVRRLTYRLGTVLDFVEV